MKDGTLFLYIISIILAFIPAGIWLAVLFKKTKHKGIQTFLFFCGILTVVPLFILQYFLHLFPQFDVINFLKDNVHNQSLNYIFLFIAVGITEEIVKQSFVRFLDRKYLLVQTINDSIQLSLVSALGFSFAENILYNYSIWVNQGIKQLFVAFLFRSVFTTCAHLIFSGIFGYYYGIAKFSLNIREQSKYIGKKNYISNFVGKIMNLPKSQAFKEVTILKGLFIAMVLHAFYDLLLQFSQNNRFLILAVVVFVILAYIFLMMLLKRKSGHLILVTDLAEQQASSMAKKDEDVVIELMGMWFKEGKYVDVIHICERLLKRDPDNKVVQLFKAQALDKTDQKNAYTKVLQTIFPPK